MKIPLLFAGALLFSAASGAQKIDVASYGEVYQGPKTMSVDLAPAQAGDKALVRISGINHEWNNKVFLASVKKVYAPYRLEYQVQVGGQTHTLMWTEHEGSPAAAVFLKPNQGNPLANRHDAIPLSFDKAAALKLQTSSLAAEWDKQAK